MEKGLEAAAAGFYKVVGYLVELRRGVVGDNVYQNLYAVLVSFLTHLGKLIAGSELIVADFEVGGLIVVVPLSVAVQLHAAVLALKTGVDRRCLNRCKACRGDVSH